MNTILRGLLCWVLGHVPFQEPVIPDRHGDFWGFCRFCGEDICAKGDGHGRRSAAPWRRRDKGEYPGD